MNTPDAEKKRVLFVDDNTDIQTVISMSLEHFGFEVRCAGNGDQALALLESFQPSIAIIDFGLPGLDGIAVGEQIRSSAIGRLTHLILFSGSFDEQMKQRGDAIGFSDYIIKPVRMQILKDRLDRLPDNSPPAVRDRSIP